MRAALLHAAMRINIGIEEKRQLEIENQNAGQIRW